MLLPRGGCTEVSRVSPVHGLVLGIRDYVMHLQHWEIRKYVGYEHRETPCPNAMRLGSAVVVNVLKPLHKYS